MTNILDYKLNAEVPWLRIDPNEFKFIPCALCGSPSYEVIGSFLINSCEFFLVKCKVCNLVWRNPLPGETFNSTLYSENYFDISVYPKDILYQVGIPDCTDKEREFRNEISKEVVKTWIDFGILPKDIDENPRKFLEIGGGRGYLQEAAENAGWDTTGVEISPYAIKSAISTGRFVLPITLNELCQRYLPYDEYFHVVVFYDFLEHVDDPGQILRIIRRIVATGGHIIFRVPNTEDFEPKFHLIDHVWHFSPETVNLLLWKENFELLRAHDSGTFHAPGIGSIENLTVLAKKSNKPKPSQPPSITVETNPLISWLENREKK